MGRTAVIVLNWNGVSDTLACLSSLAKVREPLFTTVLVDNASSDRSVSIVKSAFPRVRVLALARNEGYAGGNNAGFESLKGRGIDTVVFLNNDTVVDRGFLAPLIEALREPSTGIAVPKILYMDDPGRIWYAGGIANVSRGLFRHVGIRELDSPAFDQSGPTGYATGCCLAMRYGDFEKFGGFDAGFALYGEDVDLSLRVRDCGMEVMYVPSSKVWHRVSASAGGELNVGRQLRKAGAALKLLSKRNSWKGIASYLALMPVRSAESAFRLLLSRPFNRQKGGSTPSDG